MGLLNLCISLVAGWALGRHIVVVRVAEGVRERNESRGKKDGGRVETGSDDVGIVEDGVAVAVAIVVAGAEVDVDVIEILRGAGIGGVGNDGVGIVGIVVVVGGRINVDGGGVGVDEAVVVVVVAVAVVVVVVVVRGGVNVEDDVVVSVEERKAEGVRHKCMEADGGRRRDGGRWHAGGRGVSGARLCEQATVAERSDALGGQVVAEGEGRSVYAMCISE